MAFHMDVRLSVERVPLLREFGKYLAGVAICEQRTVALTCGAFHQRVYIGVQPDHSCALQHELACFFIDERAAACRNNLPLSIEEPCDDTPFSIPEMFFSELFEDLGDR